MFDDIPKILNLNNEIKIKQVGFDKWNEEINKLRVNRQDMNKIVLNYLIIEGYRDAVEKFIKETGVEGKLNKEIIIYYFQINYYFIFSRVRQRLVREKNENKKFNNFRKNR